MIAAIEPISLQPVGKLPGMIMENVLLIIGAAFALTLLVGLAIWYLRRRKPRRDRGDSTKVYRARPLAADQEDQPEQPEEERRRYKYRWRRRRHRQRNPTLSEVSEPRAPSADGNSKSTPAS